MYPSCASGIMHVSIIRGNIPQMTTCNTCIPDMPRTIVKFCIQLNLKGMQYFNNCFNE